MQHYTRLAWQQRCRQFPTAPSTPASASASALLL